MSDNLVPEPAELEPAAAAADDQRRAQSGVAVLAVVLLVAGLVAALVVSRRDDRTPRERFLSAGPAVTDAKTFAFELHVDTGLGGTSNATVVRGAVDATHNRSSIEFPDQLGMRGSLVTDGNVLYLPVPPAGQAQTGGKPYLRIDASALAGQYGTGVRSMNPMQSLEQLKAADATIDDVGHEDVRGVPTTHFRTKIDVAKQLPASMTSIPGFSPDELRAVPYDVWLDSSDRPRRVISAVTIHLPGAVAGGGAFTITTTMELFDYGKPVSIELPAPDSVFDGGAAPNLLGSLLNGLGTGTAPGSS